MKKHSFVTTPFGFITLGVVIAFLWGSPVPIIKLSYSELGIQQGDIWEQVLFAGYRFFIASILLLMLYILKKKKTCIQKKEFISMCKTGFFQTFLQYFFLYIGLGQSAGMTASLIVGTGPFIQILIAHFVVRGDRLTKGKLAAIVFGFVGILILYNPMQTDQLHLGWGEVFILFGAIAGSYGNLLSGNGTKHSDVLFLTGFQMFIGSLGLMFFGMINVGLFPFSFDRLTISLFGYLVFVSAVAFLLLNILFKYYQASKVSIFLCLIPIFGVLCSRILLHEPFRPQIIFSLIFIVLGIYIMNHPKAKKSFGDG